MLRESVTIKTATTDLKGELFVGADGLPELWLDAQFSNESFTPATIPAAWTIRNLNGTLEGVLLETWNAISYFRDRITCAQREVEADPCRQGDGFVSHDFIGDICIRCGLSDRDRARQREIDARTAQEIDERRKNEIAR